MLYIDVFTVSNIYVYFYIYIYIHIQRYIYIYTYIYICIHSLKLLELQKNMFIQECNIYIFVYLRSRIARISKKWCDASVCKHTHTYMYIYIYIYVCIYIYSCINVSVYIYSYTHTLFWCDACDAIHCYGVATISRLLKNIGLFCKSALLKRRYSTKETCNVKEATNRSHPICITIEIRLYSNASHHFLATQIARIARKWCDALL